MNISWMHDYYLYKPDGVDNSSPFYKHEDWEHEFHKLLFKDYKFYCDKKLQIVKEEYVKEWKSDARVLSDEEWHTKYYDPYKESYLQFIKKK